MAAKKAKKSISKKDMKKTKGGLLPAVNVANHKLSINFNPGNQIQVAPPLEGGAP